MDLALQAWLSLIHILIRRTETEFEVVPVADWVQEDDLLLPREPEMDLNS